MRMDGWWFCPEMGGLLCGEEPISGRKAVVPFEIPIGLRLVMLQSWMYKKCTEEQISRELK